MTKRPQQWRIVLGAGVLASLAMLPSARAELVYEPEVSPEAPTEVRAEDRAATRGALDASERAKNTVQVSRPIPAQAVAVPVAVQVQPQVQVAPPVQEVPATEVQSLSKTELMRRERTREELKNEDLLQERLEELRLRDEKRRTGQLLGDGSAAQAQPGQYGEQSVAPIPGLAQPRSQWVVSPVTEHPGEAGAQPSADLVAPIPTAVQAQQYSAPKGPYTPAAQAQMDQVGTSQASVSVTNGEESGKAGFYIEPRAGVSSMSVNNGFDVKGHYAVGVSGGVNVSDNIAFEVGYTYSEYGVGFGNSITNLYAPGTRFDQYTLKQNVIDASLKLYFLGQDSKLRPFVAGGFGYSMSYLNYPSNVVSVYQNTPGFSQDYSSNAYLGSLAAGLDVRVSKSVSIGAQFKYYTVLSVTESNQVYYGAYTGAAGGALSGNAFAAQDPAKQQTGASLAQSSFYTMTAGISFAF